MFLFAIYSIHLARRSFGPRPKVLSRQYRPSALTDLSDPKRGSLRKLKGDVSTSSEARINRSLTGVGSEEPVTTVYRLHTAASMKPKAAAFMVPDFTKTTETSMAWKQALTWEEYWRSSRAIAKSLIALEFQRHDVAVFFSESRPEFFVAWMGVQAAGGVCASGHPWSYKTELVRFCEMISPRIAFVDSPSHVDALKGVQGLDRVVVISDQAAFEEFLSLGKNVSDSRLDEDRIRGIRPGHASCILFSSGQSSDNRPLLLSHDNVTFSARAFLQHHENISRWGTRHPFDKTTPVQQPGDSRSTEHILSFLPLSHVGTLVLDLHVPMCLTSFKSYGTACTVWTLHKNPTNPLKRDTLYLGLVSVRPTIFIGMPAVWERFRRAIRLPESFPYRFVLQWARDLGSRWFEAVQAGSHGIEPIGLSYAEQYVFLSIKKKLGLDRAKLLMSSGAPIARDQLEFFGSLGLHIIESFGATGCSGPQTMGRHDYFVCGNVGVSLPSCELKIVPVPEYSDDVMADFSASVSASSSTVANGGNGHGRVGEICVRGRHVCIGVLNDPDATNAVIDEDGYFHTNHIGRLDKHGCLELIGRRDELVGVTAADQIGTGRMSTRSGNKKKVGLSYIEALLKERARPILDRVVVVDVRNDSSSCRLRVFGTLRREVTEESKIVSTVDRDLLSKIQQAVDSTNETLGGICTIEAFLVLRPEIKFTAFGEDPELTHTGQARRGVVQRKYQHELRVLLSDNYNSMSQQ